MTFEKVKAEYERQREEERKTLAAYLSAHDGISAAGLHVVTGGKAGKGCERYTRHGEIPAFDLRNWKWVEVKDAEGFDTAISLNMPDIDPKTKNIHCLYDRIGVIFSPEEWIYTDIDLPLDDEKRERIANLILEIYATKC